MADKKKRRKKKRLSRSEFANMVRTMGARAARDYMRDEDLFSEVDGSDIGIMPSSRAVVEASRTINLSPARVDDGTDRARKSKEVGRAAAEDVSRATGMKRGGKVTRGDGICRRGKTKGAKR